jgi:hypothetical protein
MSHQFKPGDLALTLVDDPDMPIGSCVELVKVIAKGERLEFADFTAPSEGWYVTNSRCYRNVAYGSHELMPLRGDFEPEQQKAKEAEPCA